MFSLLVVINLACAAVVRPFEITADPSDIVNRTFSYVIVGGGTAGKPYATEFEYSVHLVIRLDDGEQTYAEPGSDSIGH